MVSYNFEVKYSSSKVLLLIMLLLSDCTICLLLSDCIGNMFFSFYSL